MSKHTPGPWGVKWHEKGRTTREVYALDAKSGAELRCIGITHPEDAALIAAAPDLLALVEEAADDYENMCDPDSDSPGAVFLARLRAAIAKAKGEG